jgi:hypothetical protein
MHDSISVNQVYTPLVILFTPLHRADAKIRHEETAWNYGQQLETALSGDGFPSRRGGTLATPATASSGMPQLIADTFVPPAV